MGRRILNRKELRADFDAAERTEEEVDDDEVDDEDEDEDDDENEEEVSEDEEEEEVKPKRKRKAPAATKRKPRARTAKVVRMRVVWGVFDNSNKCVAKFDYNKKSDAEAQAAKLTAAKTNNVHFVNPIKEPMEEKEEKEEKKTR